MDPKDPTQTGGQEEEKLTPEEQIAAKVHAEQSVEFEQFDEDTGEVVPKEPKPEATPEAPEHAPEAEPEPEVAEAPVEAPVAHKVKVFGQEEEVSLEELKRSYQKGRAADIKLQEATRIKREADEYAARVTNQPAPSQDAPQQPTTPQALASVVENLIYNREANRAGARFREEFPDIASDDNLMHLAWKMEQDRIAEVTALGEDYGDPLAAYRKHGEAINKWLGKHKPAPDPVSADKLERKKTITAVPAASARAPTPQPEKPLTVAQIIEKERQDRIKGPIR